MLPLLPMTPRHCLSPSCGSVFLYSVKLTRLEPNGGLLLSATIRLAVMTCKPVSNRIIIAINVKEQISNAKEKDASYKQLYTVCKGDIMIVVGDLNAKMGSDHTLLGYVMGKNGVGDCNDYGKYDFIILTALLSEAHYSSTRAATYKVSWILTDRNEHLIMASYLRHYCICSQESRVRALRGVERWRWIPSFSQLSGSFSTLSRIGRPTPLHIGIYGNYILLQINCLDNLNSR